MKTEKERQKKKEKGRPISGGLRAALLRSFRGQHGEKMVCVRRVLWVTWTLEKANSYFDPTQTGSGATPHVEWAVDSCRNILFAS